jgi:Holliday junction DNA helicase RuvA
MIARLRGRAVARTPEGLVLDVGGVGYVVHATPSAMRQEGDEITVHTYLHVREDALQLYGFAELAERELFVQLLSVNGVGPKVALAVVSGSRASDLRRAIVLEDTARFQAIPGIGKKTAERIVLELKDRLQQLAGAPAAGVAAAETPADRLREDLVSALVNLGYHRPQAEKTIESTLNSGTGLGFEQALRQALKGLMRA